MTDLAPGKYSVTVSHDTYAPATIERIYLDSQDPFKWLEITLPLGAFVSGKVTDDEGAPVRALMNIEALNEI
ncbi:MAG: carboxypeptidase-like regulatory domain-containing protein, partial [Methanomassiliicoccales archaeon]|nr:carboxypeptidase-like regulatory domain-containing protein [Methanomassiliicoccales archaeon]